MPNNGFNLVCTATVAANDPVGTFDVVSMQTAPHRTAVTELTTPSTEVWIFDDLYITAAADSATSNPIIQIESNDSEVFKSAPLASTLITNQSRVKLAKKIRWRPVTKITMNTITTIVNDGVADAIRFEIPNDVRQVASLAAARSTQGVSPLGLMGLFGR